MQRSGRTLIAWGTAFGCLAAALGSALTAPAQGQEPPDQPLLAVRVSSGRKFTAHIDAHTSDERLWLRFSRGGGNIYRPIAWERITQAHFGGEAVELNEIREFCQQRKSKAPERTPLLAPAEAAADLPAISLPPPAVAAIRIDAWLANWDGDVETDGLYLQLSPLTGEGETIPVEGTVEVELFAAQQRKFHEAPQSRGWATELIERWSQSLAGEQPGSHGILLRLPFNAVHPEFSQGVDDWGLIHVRLVVPGSGVFERSLDGVRIRNWSPVRSGLYSQSGRWFFSTEQTGRN